MARAQQHTPLVGRVRTESHDGWELRCVGAAVVTGTTLSLAMVGFFFFVVEAEGNVMRSRSALPVIWLAWPGLGVPATALAAVGAWPGAGRTLRSLCVGSMAAAVAMAALAPSLLQAVDRPPAVVLAVLGVLAAAARRWAVVAGLVAGALVHLAMRRLLFAMLAASLPPFP